MASKTYDADLAIKKWGATDVFRGGVSIPSVLEVNFSDGWVLAEHYGIDGKAMVDRNNGEFINSIIHGNFTMRPRRLSGWYSIDELTNSVGPMDIFCNGVHIKAATHVNFDDNYVTSIDLFNETNVRNYVKFNGFITMRPRDGE